MESIINFLLWVGVITSPGEFEFQQFTLDQIQTIEKQHERYLHLLEKNPNNIDKTKKSFIVIFADELEL